MDNIYIIVVAVLAGMATYTISVYMNKGAVFGSAVITLIAGIFFPYFIPTIGSKLAVVATCSSYAGMVAVKNVPKLWEMSIVGLIAGFLFIATSNAYVGVGGKLGTIAAISCFTWIGCKKIYAMLKVSKSEKTIKGNAIDQH